MTVSKDSRRNFKILTSGEGKTLESIADRIFPKTDTPGAVEIGVLNYIDVALAGDYAALAPLYRQGLRAVNRLAQARFAKRFADLNEEQKDALLAEFETGSVRGFKKAAEFFETVRYHVLEGVFCEPQYGGNKGMIGWRLVGFPGQQFGYDDAYINRRVNLEPVAVDYTKVDKK
ncbi:MAG TPA: gluconate 2-dehydrogenase subunit 3 family protein [Candidatus Binatia bacterium]|jgi:gluconate 2-dehydrogenase gamma chain